MDKEADPERLKAADPDVQKEADSEIQKEAVKPTDEEQKEDNTESEEESEEMCESCGEVESREYFCIGCNKDVCGECVKIGACPWCEENDEYHCKDCAENDAVDGSCEIHEKHLPKRSKNKKNADY